MKRLACEEFHYQSNNGIEGACGLDIFDHGDKIVVLVRELGKGPSITNAAENIQTKFMTMPQFRKAMPHLSLDNVTFIEHYPPGQSGEEHWDFVNCTWDEGQQVYGEPVSWAPVWPHQLKELTGNVYP